MTRKKVRESLFQMLFTLDFYPAQEREKQVSCFLEALPEYTETVGEESEEALEKVRKELREKFFAIAFHLEAIDQAIESKANGWSVQRLTKADVTVLRLAIYEIWYDEKVPAGVAVNEAVEIAKRFGTEKSSAFVNGVLGTIAREWEKE